MKKTLAILLAVMMLLSTTAFATSASVDTITNGTADWFEDGENTDTNADIDVREGSSAVRYKDDAEYDIEGEMATEIWLQVEASGQIDVTVPLVLVFQTNIDGGDATSPDAYKITNYSTADLVVTKIATTLVAEDDTNNTQPMAMVAYSTTNLGEDQYAAQLSVDGGAVELGKDETGTYDLYTDATETTVLHEKDRTMGGLFEVKKATAAGDAVDTPISVAMKTGKLSFVTSRNVDDVKDDGAIEDEMDTLKGVQLMTITYTVAIDTSDAIGETITTVDTMDDGGNIYYVERYGDETEHGKLVENTTSGATKDANDE